MKWQTVSVGGAIDPSPESLSETNYRGDAESQGEQNLAIPGHARED